MYDHQAVLRQEPRRRPDPWQQPGHHHTAGFAHRTPAGIYAREPFEPLKGNLFVDASVAVIFGQKGHPAS
jgi:hypothetical protein